MELLQSNNILGTLGPELSFHDVLRKEKLNHLSVLYFNSFKAIFKALQNDQIQAALIATKNSIHGTVSNNNEVISSLCLKVIENFDLPISLHLAANNKINLADIKKVYAHPVAWNECQSLLSDYKMDHIESTSNSQALIDVKNTSVPFAAAISGEEAIKESELHLVQKNIHDREPNITTFSLVVKNKM